MNRLFWAVGLITASLVLEGAIIGQRDAPAGDAMAGKRIFLSQGCYECHGTSGAGGGYTGPTLAPNPLPSAAIKSQIRRPASRMPAYSEQVLTDAQIADIVAYLRSIPAGKSASQIPLLNQ